MQKPTMPKTLQTALESLPATQNGQGRLEAGETPATGKPAASTALAEGSRCPLCGETPVSGCCIDGGLGFMPDGTLCPGFALAIERQLARRALHRARSAFPMPRRYAETDFSDPRNKTNAEVFQHLMAWLDEWLAAPKVAATPNLVLQGIPGWGKTHAAAALVNEVCRRGRLAVLTTTIEAVSALHQYDAISRNGVPHEANEFGAAINVLYQSDLLVLDDMGKERGTDFSVEPVFDLVNSRSAEGLPVCITTNLTYSELAARNDSYDAILRRILDICLVITFDGKTVKTKRIE